MPDDALSSGGDFSVFAYGSISVALDSTTSTLACYSEDGNGNAQLLGPFAVSTTVASATGIAALASRPFGDTDTGLPLAASARGFSVQDLRLRNKVK